VSAKTHTSGQSRGEDASLLHLGIRKHLRSGWMEFWATWFSWRCPCLLQSWWPDGPFQHKPFYDSMITLKTTFLFSHGPMISEWKIMNDLCSLHLLILHILHRHLYRIKLGHVRKAGTVDTPGFLRDRSTYALCTIHCLGIIHQTCPRSHLHVTSLHLHGSDRATGSYWFISTGHIF